LKGKITGNKATLHGGGVYVNAGQFTMEGCAVVSDNEVPSGSTSVGGGVYVGGSGTFTMEGGTIGPTNKAVNGAGVFLDGASNFSMNDGTITGNIATAYSANDGNGGGVYKSGTGTFKMAGGTITGNKADNSGGGVYMNGGTFDISAAQGSSYLAWVTDNSDNAGATPLIPSSTPNVYHSAGTITGANGYNVGW